MGEEVSRGISCKDCGKTLLDEPGREIGPELTAKLFPCPDCGGTTPKVHLVLREQITLRDAVKFKGRRPGMKKPVVEGRAGSDLHRDSGEWRKVNRKIDRTLSEHAEPWYEEEITDESGHVIRQVSEPLREHRGRGSARRRKRDPGSHPPRDAE